MRRSLAVSLGTLSLAWFFASAQAAEPSAAINADFPAGKADAPLLPRVDAASLTATVVAPQPQMIEACNDAECNGDRALRFSVGERIWFSTAQSNWSFAGPSQLTGLPVNPVSELKWCALYSTVYETNFNAVLYKRLVARVDIGAGGINSGHIDDYDYNGDNRTDVGSLSRTPVTGNSLFYVTADFGYRIFSRCDDCCKPKLTVDALVGYQYWRENYFARDNTELVSNPPFNAVIPAGTFTPGPLLSEVWERNSIRVGFQGNYQLGDKVAVNSRLMFVPWAEQRMVDDHLKRNNLSFVNKGSGGFGVFWDATASYRIWKGLSAEVGYQIWFEEVDHGTNSPTIPAGVTLPLNELATFRHGVLAGLKWTF